MNITFQGHKIYVDRSPQNEYPQLGIMLAVLLLYIAPFVSMWLAVPSMAICLYRVIRYDAKVFATDYCMLLPLASLTKVPGIPMLLIYLCLLAGIWYFLKGGLRAEASFVLLIVLLNYLLTRMQMDINAFVLCFGQMFVMWVLLPKQDEKSAERTIKAFIASLILSSAYALVFRNTSAIRAICGAEVYAFWGSNLRRFKGLFQDPNYYMTLMVIGLALLIKLKECKMVNMGIFVFQGVSMVAFGILTYSKTFFLVFVLLGGIYVLWQFWNKKILSGMTLGILAVALAFVVLFAENSPFAVVMERLVSAQNLRDLTTGRSEIFLAYWKAISQDMKSFFFGKGLAAKALWRDPHNIYLETLYYVGTVGFVLIVSIYLLMVQEIKLRMPDVCQQHWIAKYVVPMMFLLLYFALHGVFHIVSYGELFLAMISMMLIKKNEVLSEENITQGKGMLW